MVTIITTQEDDSNPGNVWILMFALNGDLEALVYVKYVETSDPEAYVAANESALKTEILANGTVNDELTRSMRVIDKQLQWIWGEYGVDSPVAFIQVNENGDMQLSGHNDNNISITDASIVLNLGDGLGVVVSGTNSFLSAPAVYASDEIGINTISPGAELDVAGETYIRGDSSDATFTSPGQLAIKRGNDNPLITFHKDDGTRIGYLHFIDGNAIRLWNEQNKPILLATNDTERLRIKEDGNIGINTGGQFGGGVKVVGIADADTNPSTNPSGGGVLYSDSGALKWRGSSGTTTTMGTAEPHCPECGADYMHEWDSAEHGYLAVCVKCMADELGERSWIIRGPSRLQ